MRIVDAQIHLWTNDKAPPHHRQTPFLMDDALREMDAAGIDQAINCPAIWDKQANAYAVDAATRYPDRFATLGWFDLDMEPDGHFIDRFAMQQGMLGLRFVIGAPEHQALIANGRLDWIWQAADRLALPVGLAVPPTCYGAVRDAARRYPRMRLMIDHLGVGPFAKLPDAAAHLDALLDLADEPNIAVKATGVPTMATDSYPFASTHAVLRRVFDRFGPSRMFWGTDITRLPCTWGQCKSMFTEALPWLSADDLASVMGGAVRAWTGWT